MKSRILVKRINDHNEFITNNPFMNPVIDGHIWQVNENSSEIFVIQKAKFVKNELQLEDFKSKTAISLGPIESITNNDIVLSKRIHPRSPLFSLFNEGRHAWAIHNQGKDTM